MTGLRRVKELIAALLKQYPRLRGRKRLQLTYTAIKSLEERGEEVTLENVVKEARRIIEETNKDIDWGIKPDEYTEELAAPLLHELAEIGAVDLSPELLREVARRLRRRATEDGQVSVTVGISMLSKPV